VADEPLFVDTNVFLRVLTGDQPRMTEECRRLFERAEAGDLELWTSHLVLAEVAWTLQTVYRRSREQVAVALRAILDIPRLSIEGKEMLRDAVDAYRSVKVDFVDAYHATMLRRGGIERVCSYDRDFDTLGMERVEPGAVV
jgi:predicted nucleic acid-binding protein